MEFKVGDRVLFDHFGAKDRPGEVVKVTPRRVYIRWAAPTSQKTRVVPITRGAEGRPVWKNVRIVTEGE